VRVKLRQSITAEDLKQLEEAHRILVKLMTGLHPACPGHAPLYASAATVRACAAAWSGDAGIWGTANVRLGAAISPGASSPGLEAAGG
jgi:hypothetical protein